MVWGGDKIAQYKGIKTDIERIGESWEVSGVPEHQTAVANGALRGQTITELVKEYKGRLVGEHVYARNGDEFPLLIKFIDALSDLSIQVHPDDAMAMRRHGQRNGKTEMWYVMEADLGAKLISGFRRNTDPEEYRAVLAAGHLEDLLHSEEPKAGDVYFIPAGRVHALGKGLMVAEIQQTSDCTYRIYDYNRVDKDGKQRQLHTEVGPGILY